MSHLTAFQNAMQQKGYDAAIVSDKMNQRYLTNFDFDDGLVLVTLKDAYLLTDFRYVEAARAQASSEFTVLTPKEGHLACIGSLLSAGGCRTVATEERSLSCASYARYRKILEGFTLTEGASELFASLRIHKDEQELETIARAQAITDAAFEHILKVITPDMTEIEVALELEFFMRRNGSEGIAFDTLAVSGTNSARPHGVPRYCKL